MTTQTPTRFDTTTFFTFPPARYTTRKRNPLGVVVGACALGAAELATSTRDFYWIIPLFVRRAIVNLNDGYWSTTGRRIPGNPILARYVLYKTLISLNLITPV